MPIMGGIDVLKVARADDRLRQVPIIVLTTDETKKGEAMEVGANEFLMKPIRKDDLVEKMNMILV
jgi:putative two-component system response regulator